MAERNIKISKRPQKVTTPGLHRRIVLLTGKDKGMSYYLIGKRAVIGRGDEADIQILDENLSKKHT